VPNVASILKQEIARVARRELRSETAALKRASAAYRGEIAALKRRVAETERKLRSVTKASPRAQPAANDESTPEGTRFSAKGLAGHRKRLGLSANDLGLLLGVSGQTIYNWETGKARPHRKFLPTLVAMRKVGKKETFAQLEQLRQQKRAA
jgi:DNA-binding transcriptional regulator YiaG